MRGCLQTSITTDSITSNNTDVVFSYSVETCYFLFTPALIVHVCILYLVDASGASGAAAITAAAAAADADDDDDDDFSMAYIFTLVRPVKHNLPFF